MNLFNKPTQYQLKELIAACEDMQNYYDLIVNNEGEVIIMLSVESSIEMLNKFRFYFRALLRGRNTIGKEAAQNQNYIHQLFNDLIFCFNNNMCGQVNYDSVSRIRNLVFSIGGNIKQREIQDVELS